MWRVKRFLHLRLDAYCVPNVQNTFTAYQKVTSKAVSPSLFESWAGARGVGRLSTAAERCVMFGLNLSARPAEATVNTAADCADCEPSYLWPALSPFAPSRRLPCPFNSAQVCCDAAGLEKCRDVFLSLRRPHQPGHGAPQQSPPLAGGGHRQVSFKCWHVDVYGHLEGIQPMLTGTLPLILTTMGGRTNDHRVSLWSLAHNTWFSWK